VRAIEINPTTIARLRKREIFIGCPSRVKAEADVFKLDG
jgi:hypothetical protein